MFNFDKLYKQLVFEQKFQIWVRKNNIIFEEGNWFMDKIAKPLGGTIQGIGDTITSLAKADIKGVTNGIAKTISSPVKLTANIIKAPADAIEAATKMTKSGDTPPEVKKAAAQINDDEIERIKKENQKIRALIKQQKLKDEQQRLFLASIGAINVGRKYIKKAAKNSENKKQDAKEQKKEEVKLTQNQQKMLDIFIESSGMDEAKGKALFMKYLSKGKILLYNGKKKKKAAFNVKKFDSSSEKYIAFAQKVNLNKTEDADAEVNDYSDDEQVKEYTEVAIPVIARMLKKDPNLITKRMNRRIKRGQIYVIENGKPQSIKIEQFKEKFDTYIEAVEDDAAGEKEKSEKEKAAKDAATAKEKAEKMFTVIAKQSDGKYKNAAEVMQNWQKVKEQIKDQPAWKSPKGKQKLAKMDAYVNKKLS